MRKSCLRIYSSSLAVIKRHKWFIVACLTGFLVYLVASVYKHLHFNSTGFDLVIFDQAVRHYSQFVAPASSFRGFSNLLGDHFHPILALLAPLYWIYDSPTMLLFAQAALITSAALPVYLFATKKIGRLPAVLSLVTFLFSAALLRAVYFDFHEIAFAIPLIAWAIYCMEAKKWLWMYIVLTLLLLTKESFGVLVVFFGLYLLVQRKFIHGAVLVVSGIVVFLAITKVVIPYFSGTDTFMYWSYNQLGEDLGSSLLAIIKNPLFALSLLIFPVVKLATLAKTFGAFLAINFLSPLMILAIPLILERFLSSNENYWQFNFHYGATLMPIVVMAYIDGLPRLYRFKFMQNFPKEKVYLSVTATTAAITAFLFFLSPLNFIFNPSTYAFSDDERKGHSLLSSVPDDKSICTTNRIAPHVGQHELKLIGFSTVTTVNCDVIITSNSYDQSVFLQETLEQAKGQGYTVKQASGSWRIYER